jgi:cysteinyl-tRNA synthetase
LNEFSNALDDDLNISKAWGVIFGWIRDLNRAMAQEKLTPEQAIIAIFTWKTMDKVLGLNLEVKIPLRIIDVTAHAHGIGLPVGFAASIEGEEEAPREIIELAEERILAKKAKDFKHADIIREQIKSKGWVIEDTPKGPKLKKL